jgi:hypothetical protein
MTMQLFAKNGGGALDISAVARHLGSRSRAHGVLYNLSKQGLLRRIGKGSYQLAEPATMPAKTSGQLVRSKSGSRIAQGAGPQALRQILAAGGLRPIEIRDALAGDQYQLTARGAKAEA